MSGSPRTPARETLSPEDVEGRVERQSSTPGGVAMDIVLTPALKPAPRALSQPSSPLLPLDSRLEAAEARRAALDWVRARNIQEQLARVEAARGRREGQEQERSSRTREELEAKLEKTGEKRNAQIAETKEKLVEHLSRVERAQRELEVSTEAARLAAEFALTAKMMRAEENKDEQLEGMLRKIKEHEAYVARVRTNQEERLRPYFAELEVNIKEKLTIAEKRREEVLGKVVQAAREDARKVELVRQNKAKLQEQQAPAVQDTVPESA